jgi:hypothetical protein
MVVPSSLLYFYCGALTILVCIYSYYQLRSLALSRKCVFYGLSVDSFAERMHGEKKCKADMSPVMFSSPLSSSRRDKELYGAISGGDAAGGDYESFTPVVDENTPLKKQDSDPPQASPTDQTDFAEKMRVFRKAFPNLMVVFTIFVSTLLLWPAVVTEIPSYNFPYLEQTRWWSLILLFIFAISDCGGRLLVANRHGITASNVWFFAFLRTVICIPLVVCSAKGIFFTNDLWSVSFILLLGLTNGYLGSLSIMLVNDVVEESEQGLAGTFTGVFLNGGLVVGATLSLLADKIINSV